MSAQPGLIPEQRSATFTRLFSAYSERLMRRDFNALRLERGSRERLAHAAAGDEPILLLMNHPSWWDPLLALVLARRFLPQRTAFGPIDAAMLQRFAFMRRLGLFGLDPAHPAALRLLLEHTRRLFEREPAPLLVLTPQGALSDVRRPIRLRPGAAAIAARHAPGLKVVLVAIELPFWLARRPEILLRAIDCEPPPLRCAQRIAAWQHTLTRAMQANAEALAALALHRDPADFETLFEARVAVNPAYDFAQRLRGREARLERRASGHPLRSRPA